MKKAFMLIIALTAFGCSSAPRYTNENSNQTQFTMDRLECMKEAGTYNCPAFVTCLSIRGYREDKDGVLEVPKDQIYPCSPPSQSTVCNTYGHTTVCN